MKKIFRLDVKKKANCAGSYLDIGILRNSRHYIRAYIHSYPASAGHPYERLMIKDL